MNKSFEIINNVFLFFTGILFISFGYFLFESSIVGTKIKTLILFCIFLILILFFFLNKKIKNLFVKILLLIFTISLIGFESFGIFALNEASNVVSKITDYNSENTKKYSIIVRKDSKYKNISDIKGKNVYISQNISKKDFDEILENFSKENGFSLKTKEGNDYLSEFKKLMSKEIDVMILDESYRSIIDEKNKKSDKTKIIYETSVSKNVEFQARNVKEGTAFNIFISGIDTKGPVTTTARSDVNLLMTVNPKSHKILLTSIPRDTYTRIAGDGNNQFDKLTHSGIYGIESTIRTVENLLNTQINYYVRVNFDSFVHIIDAIGGVSVENNQYFISRYRGFEFDEGEVNLDGEKALAFVRERYSLEKGDTSRRENQEKVLKAMINKALSPSILSNYSKIMKTIENDIQTNMPSEKIVELVNGQLEFSNSWQINSVTIDGEGYVGLSSYAMPYSQLYMYKLDDDDLKMKRDLIYNTLIEN